MSGTDPCTAALVLDTSIMDVRLKVPDKDDLETQDGLRFMTCMIPGSDLLFCKLL